MLGHWLGDFGSITVSQLMSQLMTSGNVISQLMTSGSGDNLVNQFLSQPIDKHLVDLGEKKWIGAGRKKINKYIKASQCVENTVCLM